MAAMNTMPSLSTFPSAISADGINSYLNYIHAIPVLEEEEERELFERFHRGNDLEAARKIILSHLRFVAHIAKTYIGYGLPMEDLIQEGNIGLMKSVKRFDLSRGVRLASFAVYWIKAEIHEFVLKNWRLVKIATTKAQRKLFFNLRKSKKGLGWLTKEEAYLVARDLGVTTKDVIDMESRLHQQDCYFDESYGDNYSEDIDAATAPIGCLVDNSQRPDFLLEHKQRESMTRVVIKGALSLLDSRSRDIIESRWLRPEKVGLKVLAQRYDISMERVRQIEQAALMKIRQCMSCDLKEEVS